MKARSLGLALTVGVLGCASPDDPTALELGPTRAFDDQLALVGEFHGFVDETGFHLEVVPTGALAERLQQDGVATEALVQRTQGTGSGRGLNPDSTYELVTCSATANCAPQYGSVITAGTYAPGSTNHDTACADRPESMSGTCYAADVELRTFYGIDLANLYVVFNATNGAGGANSVLPFGGTGAVLDLPASVNNNVYRYGTLEPGPTGTANLDSPYHQAGLRRWRFAFPAGTTDFGFTFSGNVYATSAVVRAPHQLSVTATGGADSTSYSSGCLADNGDLAVYSAGNQVYLHHRRRGAVTLISRTSSGSPGNGTSSTPCISADGSTIVYQSQATDIVAADTNAIWDIYAFNVSTGATTLVSANSAGVIGSNCGTGTSSGSLYPSLSADGRYVAFNSTCTTLCGGVAGCTTSRAQVFRKDRSTGTLTGVSLRPTGTFGTGPSLNASISGDGNLIAFQSTASNLVASDTATGDIFVRNVGSSSTVRITNNSAAARLPSMARDGAFVAFGTTSTTLVTGISDTSDLDVFRCPSGGGTCQLVSCSSGLPTSSPSGTSGSTSVAGVSISRDGRYVAFQSTSSGLVAGDSNGRTDIFVRDMNSALVTRVNLSPLANQADANSSRPRIATSGNYVMFESLASNLQNDTAGAFDSGDSSAQDVFSVAF